MASRRGKLLFLLLVCALVAIWLVLQPGCPVRNMTGVPCPGCGMSRAWGAALKLDFRAALNYHPMFWSVPVVIWLGWNEFRPSRNRWINIVLTACIAGGLLITYALRLYEQLIV